MVDTYFWSDPWVEGLDQKQRYLFLYLVTNQMGNAAGIFEVTDERMQRETKLKASEINSILKTFSAAGKVYRQGWWIIMRNWPKHQNIKSPGIQEGIMRILSTIPEPIFQLLLEIGYPFPRMQEAMEKRIPAGTVGGRWGDGGKQEKDGGGTVVLLTRPNLTKLDLTEFDSAKHKAIGSVMERIKSAVAEGEAL